MTIEIVSASFPSLPPAKKGAFNAEKRIREIETWARSLSGQLSSYAYMPAEYAESQALTLTEIADGLNTSSLVMWSTIADDGGKPVNDANATYSKTGDQLNALTGMTSGDTCYVTADSTASPDRKQGEIWRYDGANWQRAGNTLYGTTITAGSINLTSSTFYGTLPTTYTAADKTSANPQSAAWLTTKIEPGNVRITSGGDTVLLSTLLKDSATWDNANPDGLYVSTTYIGFWNTVTNTWPVYIKNDGSCSFYIDANNQITLAAGAVTIKATAGWVGSTTNYFDITNGIMRLTATGAGVSGSYTKSFLANHYIYNSSDLPVGRFGADINADYTGLCSFLQAGVVGGYPSGATTAVLTDFTIKECAISTTGVAEAGGIRYNSGDLELHNGAAWKGCLDLADHTGALPAVSGALLTALPAAQLTGTVPAAALPTGTGKIASGSYAGSDSTDKTQDVGFTIRRLTIKSISTTTGGHELLCPDGIAYGSAHSWDQESGSSATSYLYLSNATTFVAVKNTEANNNTETHYWVALG